MKHAKPESSNSMLLEQGILLFRAIKLGQRMEAATLLAEALVLAIGTSEGGLFQVLLADAVTLIVLLFPAKVLATAGNLHKQHGIVSCCFAWWSGVRLISIAYAAFQRGFVLVDSF